MKPRYYSLLALLACGGCHKDSTSDAAPGTLSLVGHWRLTKYECACPAGQPLPDETIDFDLNRHFALFRGGKLVASGTYGTALGSACTGGSGSTPLLQLTNTEAPTYLPTGAYTLTSSQLIVDQCSAADGPRYTYTRQ